MRLSAPFRFSITAAAFCQIILAGCITVTAADFTAMRLGFNGEGKVGRWLPLRAEAADLTPGETVTLLAAFPDPRGDTCVEKVATEQVAADGTVSLSGYFRSGRLEGTGVVSIAAADSNQTLCRTTIHFAETAVDFDPQNPRQQSLRLRKLDAQTLMTVGDVEGIEELLRNVAAYSSGKSILQGIQLAELSALPDQVEELDAVNMILLTDNFETTNRQATAVKQWVRDGGKLFVCAGGTVDQLVESELGRWLASHFQIQQSPIRVRRFTGLETFVPGASRIQTNLRGQVDWPVAMIESEQSSVLVDSLDGPLIARQSIGAGVVTLVAIDVNQRPFSLWTSLPQFYEVLFFGEKLSQQTADRSRTSRISQSGVSDLATQVLAAVDANPGSGQWSTWSVMAMLIGWLILIGPIDYLLVTRVFKRPHLTWVTFPLLIATGTALLVMWAGQNSEFQSKQLHLLDVYTDDNEQHLVNRSWLSASSPDTARISLKARAFREADLNLTWGGRPEDIFGAMYRKGGIGLGRQSYVHDRSTSNSLENLPLLTNGSRGFEARWRASSKDKLLESELSVSGFGMLNGTFTHSLPGPIRNWIIGHGNRAYRATDAAAEIAPGQPWDSRSETVYASDLKAFLNGARLVKSTGNSASNRGSTQVVTPYDAQSTDLSYIMAMVCFYEFSGGAEYAGLSHTMLRQLDVSDTIRLNHAVLIGEIDLPSTTISIDGEPLESADSTTMVRLFLPVDRQPNDDLARTKEDIEKQAEEKQP